MHLKPDISIHDLSRMFNASIRGWLTTTETLQVAAVPYISSYEYGACPLGKKEVQETG